VYRALIGDRQIIAAIDDLADRLRASVPGRDVRPDTGRLRLLDAALWTLAAKKKRR
jgi:hypothetical protein